MSNTLTLDKFDVRILQALQENADYSMHEIGERVGLSHTPCWRRVKKLEQSGWVKKRIALLDANALNLSVSVHAYITIKSHDKHSLNAFEQAVQDIPEIVECYSTTGDKDYLLRVIVSNVDSYEQLLKKQRVHLPKVASINSTFALKQVNYTTELPLCP